MEIRKRLLNIAPVLLLILATVLFGTMQGERDNFFSAVLGLLITSLLVLALTTSLCLFLPEALNEWPILLASANSLAGLFLLIAWLVFIAAMAQGGPVKPNRNDDETIILSNGSPFRCDEQIQIDKEFCREQREECFKLIDECSERAETRSPNHHCNSAMAFVTISVFVVGLLLFKQWREISRAQDEDEDRKEYHAPNQKRQLDSPRPSRMI